MTCHLVTLSDMKTRVGERSKKGKVAKYGTRISEDTSERESHDDDDGDDILPHSQSYALAPKIAEL